MAGNLNVGVTADVTDLRSKLALASQDVKTTSAALNAAAKEAIASGQSFDQAATSISRFAAQNEAARAKVKSLTADLAKATAGSQQMGQTVSQSGQQVENAHQHMAASGGVTREVLVMLHETMMGNYKRLAGSTVVLAERTNVLHSVIQGLTPAIMGAVGAAAALAGGLVVLALRAHEAAVALNEAANAATLLGRSGPAAKEAVTGMAETLKQGGVVGHAAAYQIASAIEQLPDAMESAKARMNALSEGFFVVFQGDGKKTAEEMGKIFEDTGSLERYLAKWHVLDAEGVTAWTNARTDAEKFNIGLTALEARLAGPIAKYKEMNDQAKIAQANASLGVTPGTGGTPDNAFPPTSLGDTDTGTTAPSPGVVEDRKAVLALNAVNQDRLKIENEIAAAQRDWQRAAVSRNMDEMKSADLAIATGKAKLAALTDPAQQAAYAQYMQMAQDADNAAVVSAAGAGKKRVEITEAGLRAEIAVYQKAAQDETLSEKQRLEARAQATKLSISLTKDEASGRTAGANKAFETEVARYNAEIAAAKGNADQILGLEKQKLDFIRNARGENSREYQEALKEETAAVGSAVTQQVHAIEDAGKRRIADQKATLKEEAATQQITKAEEAQQLLQFVQSERDMELQALDTLRSSLAEGTVAYKEATDARAKLIQSFGTQIKTLNAQVLGDDTKTAERFTESWLGDFSQIGRAGEQAFAGLVTGQTTMQKAEQDVAKAILTSFLQLGTQIAERWMVTQLAMTSSSATQAAVRTAQESAISNTGFGVLLAKWFAKEQTQTSMTAAGAAERATADSGGGFLSAIGQILARWLGLEAAKTGATTAGASTRSAADGVAATAGAQLVGTAARSEIADAAAVAAAWAFADSAMLGPVGLIAAPAAAAAAEGTVMSFQALVPALAVGAGYVPHDMLAQIHQGEMVVPRPFADSVRSGDTTIGGSGPLTINHSPTYTGSGPQLAAQAARVHGDLVSTVMGALRNGALKVPGR